MWIYKAQHSCRDISCQNREDTNRIGIQKTLAETSVDIRQNIHGETSIVRAETKLQPKTSQVRNQKNLAETSMGIVQRHLLSEKKNTSKETSQVRTQKTSAETSVEIAQNIHAETSIVLTGKTLIETSQVRI